jgi:hypothetical protein
MTFWRIALDNKARLRLVSRMSGMAKKVTTVDRLKCRVTGVPTSWCATAQFVAKDPGIGPGHRVPALFLMPARRFLEVVLV